MFVYRFSSHPPSVFIVHVCWWWFGGSVVRKVQAEREWIRWHKKCPCEVTNTSEQVPLKKSEWKGKEMFSSNALSKCTVQMCKGTVEMYSRSLGRNEQTALSLRAAVIWCGGINHLLEERQGRRSRGSLHCKRLREQVDQLQGKSTTTNEKYNHEEEQGEKPTPHSRHFILDSAFSTLHSPYSILHTRHSILHTPYSISIATSSRGTRHRQRHKQRKGERVKLTLLKEKQYQE